MHNYGRGYNLCMNFSDNVLERLGRRGGMNAAAGGSSFADATEGSSRTRIRFQEGRE